MLHHRPAYRGVSCEKLVPMSWKSCGAGRAGRRARAVGARQPPYRAGTVALRRGSVLACTPFSDSPSSCSRWRCAACSARSDMRDDRPARTRRSSAPIRAATRRSWRRRRPRARRGPPARRGPRPAPAPAPATPPAPAHVTRGDEAVASFGPADDAGPTLHVQAPWDGYDEHPAAEVIKRVRAGDEATRAVVLLTNRATRPARASSRPPAGSGPPPSRLNPSGVPADEDGDDRVSAPPPTTGPPGAGARHEHMIELESSGKWKRKKSVDFLKFSPLGMELHHTGVLVMPLTMPLGAIALACTESGPARPMAGEGRFPVLKRISSSAVVPRDQGVEGWLWTSSGGSAFPSLCDEDQAPNVAILFAHPLGEEMITRRFVPEFARRSPPARRSAARSSTACSCASATSCRRSASSPSSASPSRSPTKRSHRRCGARCPPTSPRTRWSPSLDSSRASRSVAPPGLA